MKKEIEKLFINATYNDEAPNVFADKVMALFGKDSKETRSSLQSRARWKYLTMVASILNDQGQTFTIPGTDYEMKFTKDILYENYWQYARLSMYPGKRKQLNTGEFSNLVDVVMALFAKIFEITIGFPNFKDMVKPVE